MKSSREYLYLGLVLLNVFLFHGYFLAFHDLRLDELITSNMLIRMNLLETIQYLFKLDSPSILYYVYIYAVKEIFGLGLWSLRGASLFLSLLCLIEFYRLCKEFLTPSMSLVSVFMLGISFTFLLYGGEIRPYALLLYLSVAASRYYVLIGKDNRVVNYYKYFLIIGLMCATHLSGFLLFFVHALDAFIFNRAQILKSLKKPQLFFALIITLPMFYQAIRIFNHQHAYRETPSLLDFLSQMSFLFNGKYFVVLAISLIIYSYWKGINKRELLFFILVSIGPLVLLFLKSLISAPAFEARYVLYSLPILILTLMYSVERISNKTSARSGLILSLSILIMGNCFIHEKYHQRPYRIDSKGAADLVMKIFHSNPSAGVVSCGACLHYYLYQTLPNHLCNLYDSNFNEKMIYIEYTLNKKFCSEIYNTILQGREALKVHEHQLFQIFELSSKR